MKNIKVGIIGIGNMGLVHAEFFLSNKIKNATLCAVADNDTDRLKYFKKLYPETECKLFNSGFDLIDSNEVEAVIIATPHYFHVKLSEYALKNNVHVLCEKPVGVYTKEIKRLNHIAKNSNSIFTVMFNQRANSLYKKMREIINSGSLGEIKRTNWIITNWYRPQSYYDSGSWRATWAGEGGGVLINQAIHQLDLMLWITGLNVKKVHSFCHFGKWHNIEVEDDVTAYFEYENGANGTFITSTGDTPGSNRFEILGTGGRLLCENKKLIFDKLITDERTFCKDNLTTYGEPEKSTTEYSFDEKFDKHSDIINNFIAAIMQTKPLYIDGKDAIKSIELMNSILLSAWTNKTVKYPINENLYYKKLKKKIKNSRAKSVVCNKKTIKRRAFGSF